MTNEDRRSNIILNKSWSNVAGVAIICLAAEIIVFGILLLLLGVQSEFGVRHIPWNHLLIFPALAMIFCPVTYLLSLFILNGTMPDAEPDPSPQPQPGEAENGQAQ